MFSQPKTQTREHSQRASLCQI